MKIGIVTWFQYHNYGSALQATALTKIIKGLGHTPFIVNYKNFKAPVFLHRKGIVEDGVERVIDRVKNHAYHRYEQVERENKFNRFLDDNCLFTKPVELMPELESLNDELDAFVCGSDQIWAPSVFDAHYFLDFVRDDYKKIAYAPSVGLPAIDDINVKNRIKEYTSKIGHISTREKTGSKIIEDLIGKHVETVLDPTLLVDSKDWSDMASDYADNTKPYILVYMLGKNENHWKKIKSISKKLNIEVKIIPVFFKEYNEVVSRGVPAPKIMISDRAQIVMPYHILFDQYEEERLGGKSFGSTKSGIAPFYSDKYAKIGFQVNELFHDDSLREKVERVVETKNILLEHLYHKPLLDPNEIFDELMKYKEMVAPYVGDVSLFLWNALKEGKEILLEGQLGSLKDPDHGIYPMVTSSSTLAAYGAIGAGVPPYEIKKVVTVCKAYSSAVGAGAFVSEIFGEEADELRRRGGDGGEYGATTGRPRRMGWFDCVASKYGCRMQGATDVAFTVLDVLGYLDEIPVCTGYEIDGKVTTEFPTTGLLEKAKPVLEVLPGWKSDIRGIKNYDELPENCRKYIEFVEKQIGFPITMISNGPGRNDIIYRNK